MTWSIVWDTQFVFWFVVIDNVINYLHHLFKLNVHRNENESRGSGGTHFVTAIAGIWHKRHQHPNTSKRVRMDPNTSKRVRTRPKASKNVWKGAKTFRKGSKSFEEVKNFRRLLNASKHFWTHPNAYERSQMPSNVSKTIRNALKNFQTYSNAFDQ